MAVVEQVAQTDLGRTLTGLKTVASSQGHDLNEFLAAGPRHSFAALYKSTPPLPIPEADTWSDDDREPSDEDDEDELGEDEIDEDDIDQSDIYYDRDM